MNWEDLINYFQDPDNRILHRLEDSWGRDNREIQLLEQTLKVNMRPINMANFVRTFPYRFGPVYISCRDPEEARNIREVLLTVLDYGEQKRTWLVYPSEPFRFTWVEQEAPIEPTIFKEEPLLPDRSNANEPR